MRVGSIVECIADFHNAAYTYGINVPERGKTYVVRTAEAQTNREGRSVIFITLEEIVNKPLTGYNFAGQQLVAEPMFAETGFKEVQPPEDGIRIMEILEELEYAA